MIEVAPGDLTTEYHLHHHEDECVYVLDGEGTARIGAEFHAIGPGDFLGYRKGGLAHAIENTGAVPLRCLVIGARLPHDVGDYPDRGKRILRQAGLPWNLVDHDAIETPKGGAK
nr:cupin domain-containing protein [Jannaschia sp. S6380]